MMRILIFHGYLLDGTGSNVYNARLAAALVGLGHEVHLLCQDRHPDEQPFVDAVGDWDSGGALRVRALREEVRCTVYRPDVGSLLPVYVADRYEGIEARTFAECSEAEVASYIDANVAAVREVVARAGPDLALANHLVMGPVILARALRGEVPYAVKVHGSALEYTVKPHSERFLGFAREGLAGARAVLVGSHHTAASLWAALADPTLPARTRLGPPGVDVARFHPRDRERAVAGLRELTARLRSTSSACTERETSASAFARDELAAADTLERLEPTREQLVAFVGKLIVNKGVDLLLASWPLVLQSVPNARLVVVGFGADRALLERLLGALAAGDLSAAEDMALPHLLAFLRALDGNAHVRYLTAARALPERVLFTGRLDHDELTDLLPVCEALVVPSTFPEAFGMVAAEAAACGVLPISAAHSGLAEVSGALAHAVPDDVAPWLSFPVDDSSVVALAERILAWLTVDGDLRERTRAGLVATVRELWSWEGVARGVIAAARGELDALAEP
ncbi:MAG TPA: glycosyltransferase family 4 protein [Solirubrobacteraceae bacterium]|jgi:glycosyltransferase involved in cell wall biosynthesis|nr:glycosyltransferase family 4 protein [Solirubrobacteraceae bacterium]